MSLFLCLKRLHILALACTSSSDSLFCENWNELLSEIQRDEGAKERASFGQMLHVSQGVTPALFLLSSALCPYSKRLCVSGVRIAWTVSGAENGEGAIPRLAQRDCGHERTSFRELLHMSQRVVRAASLAEAGASSTPV